MHGVRFKVVKCPNRGSPIAALCMAFAFVLHLVPPSSHAGVSWSGPQNIEMGAGPGDPGWGGVGNTYIDYDGDGSTDIRLRFSHTLAFLAIPQLGPDGLMNEITAEQRVTRPLCWPLDSGTVLGPVLPGNIIWHPEQEPLIEWFVVGDEPVCAGTWYNASNRYMGVRFDTGAGNTHYGWVQMTVSGEFMGAIVHDWAWNTVPGESILAGDTGFHHVSPTGSHTLPYSTWATAATNIQAAVDVAQYGAHVVVTDGVYAVSSPISITNGITVVSANGRDSVTIDGQNMTQCVFMDHPDAVLDGFTITRGYAEQGGGVLCSNGVVRNCMVTNNEAVNFRSGPGGGGIYCGPGGVISNCLVVGNRASSWDGGSGGGVVCLGGLVADCAILDNVAGGFGGGVAVAAGGTIRRSRIEGNTAGVGGGVAAIQAGIIEQCRIVGNRAIGGSATLGGTPSIGGGVALYMHGRIRDSVVMGNSTDGYGGGITSLEGGRIERCSIRDNAADGFGGGVWLFESEMSSSIVAGNTALQGGGVWSGFIENLELWPPSTGSRVINCTVAENTALVAAGGVMCVSNAVVWNTIIWANEAPAQPNVSTSGVDNVFLHNCTTPLLPGVGNIDTDPLLTPAYRLTAASPCIDTGTDIDAPERDIDGEARWDHPGHSNVVSIVDIGADEFVDTDLDNMADHWEIEHFGCITLHNGTGDADSDELSDLAEYEHGTDPNNQDTDGDGMPDGWEVRHGFVPLNPADAGLDADDDGMSNLAEYTADTDPRDPDSVLSFIRVDRQFGGIRVDWKGGREAWQILECRENLASTTEQWTAIFALPPPTALTNAVIDMGVTNSVLFYRIRAER